MDATKPYEFIGFGAMDATKPYEFIGFGAVSVRAGRLGVFLYLYWTFFDFVSIRELFGMSGGPRSRPWGVDCGPGEGCSEGVRGAHPYKGNTTVSPGLGRILKSRPNIGLRVPEGQKVDNK